MPGRMKTCSSARFAVRVRRGSTTTSLPPRPRSALSRPGKSGAVQSEPFDSSGLAPSMSRYPVRSRSGTGMVSGWPNIRPLDTCFGIWSAVLAEKTLRVPSARISGPPYREPAMLCAFGLPR